MSTWLGLMIVTAAAAVGLLGCAQQPGATAAVVADKTYTVTPGTMPVKAGIVTGTVTEMKVTERIEQGSGRVISPAKLTGKVVLKNSSVDQTLRLVGGTIRYVDAQGQSIKLEATQTQSALKFSAYSNERLDPGQEATQSLDVDFPTAALKARTLKEIRLDLVYLPSPYREETVRFNVAIGGQ